MKIRSFCKIFVIFLLLSLPAPVFGAFTVTDDLDREITFQRSPRRIISLSPGATEIICALKAQAALAGVSTEDEYFTELIGIPVVGPPTLPAPDIMTKYKPDLVIIEPQNADDQAIKSLSEKTKVLVFGASGPLEKAENRVHFLGRLLGKDKEAKEVINQSQELLQTIAQKTAKIEKPLKVIRLVGREGKLFVTGASSWSSQAVLLAGGTLPIGLTDDLEAELSPSLISKLNPDLMYACGRDSQAIEAALANKNYQKLPVVKNNPIRYFPCALTDRAAAHMGYFVAWLSSVMYPVDFGIPENLVKPEEILSEKTIELKNLPMVKKARVVYARQSDFIQKSLLIELTEPLEVISTQDGPKKDVTVIGNCSSPPMVWDIHHQGGWEADMANRYRLLGVDQATASLMFTGADMDNMSIKTVSQAGMTVTALVTAGADGNAIRTARDVGAWIEPGTINIIVLTSRTLSPAGATRALITVTEAKTAALWDLGIRSTQTPLINPATGTGTDSIIMVSGGGKGRPIDYTGGHAKIGELIASSVHAAVTEALANGNGRAPNRNVLIRLRERGLYHEQIFTGPKAASLTASPNWADQLAAALIEPHVAGFIESAMSLDDAIIMGQVSDISLFDQEALQLASELSGRQVNALMDVADPSLPKALKIALDAVGTGLALKLGEI
ncbi:MAG: adenosylcobinamide amidohydrolase [Deltaproteobacteria bacterium]|nr:adenosylcobinamide amidohydrolase [Deltaproteobacteria bacterium]